MPRNQFSDAAVMASERVLSGAEAAERIGLSHSTFKRLRRRGELPPAILISDRRVGWKLSALLNWLNGREVA